MSGAPTLQVDQLKTHFFTKAGVVKAVDGVSFDVGAGEILGLVGEFWLRQVDHRLLDPGIDRSAGTHRIRRRPLQGRGLPRALDEERMRRLRGNRIAMIFQDPMMTLNPVLRIDTQMTRRFWRIRR